jgi:archaemetzincin
MPPKASSQCDHAKLTFMPSSHASIAGYKRATLAQRTAATTPRGTGASKLDDLEEDGSTFPAPLVLPEDELSWDPKSPGQSLCAWIRLKERNHVTPERRTVYFVGPMDVEPGLEFVQGWKEPRVQAAGEEKPVRFPETGEVWEYLQAFYHGMPVNMLPTHPVFTTDVEDDKPARRSKGRTKGRFEEERVSPILWLNTHTSSGCIGVRTRATPNGAFSHQLNLNDLLDAAIEMLPDDAYALLMLVEHDIYEDEEDDFACGRAYGGSRIAVVSGARYNPILDKEQRVEREHGWPVSHCARYIEECCEDGAAGKKKKKQKVEKREATWTSLKTPMHGAVAAHLSLPPLDVPLSAETISGLWLGRVCRTASHELGHCFGIGHCVYYACSMQGTASIIEDSRQPPYLCPIDLAKVLRATGADEKERYRALLAFCDKHSEAHLFVAFAAWIKGRLWR